MKALALLIATSCLISFTIISGATWFTNLEEAKTEATHSNKTILLNFSGSDWCTPCIRLKTEIFTSEVFIEYANANLVLANADFPRLKRNQLPKSQLQHNEALAEQYNPEGKFPLTLLLTTTGKIIKKWDGIPQKTPEQFIDEIKKTLTADH
jgi:thioredoxin-related protein